MTFICEPSEGPLIVLHGGAGPQDPDEQGLRQAVDSLRAIAASGMKKLLSGSSLIEVATHCLVLLEDDPQFNAGFGSALQADGLARVSASLMESKLGRFSGIVSGTYIKNPSLLLGPLQQRSSRVLTSPGVELLARELGLPRDTNITPKRLSRWLARLGDQRNTELDDTCDTVGVLIRNADNEFCAASSTGGRGFEFPGRVSDTPTCAANYASRFAACCATGVGEQIVDDALAARLETRIRDGLSLYASCQKTYDEAITNSRQYGLIACDKSFWAAWHTTPSMAFVAQGAKGIVTSKV